MMVRIFLAVAASVLLVACATRYEGSGIQASRIDENTLKVTADGNLFADMGLLEEYVLLRAAEETIALGFTHFAIVSATDRSKIFTSVSPGRATTNTMGQASVFGTGNSATVHGLSTSTTTYDPPQVSSFSTPGVEIIARMFDGNQELDDRLGVWDAGSIVKYLGPKHKKE